VIPMDVQPVLRADALNGECPRWRADERRLYWIDMRAPALHRLDPDSGHDEVWQMPDWIGCYAFMCDGALLAALRGGLYRFDPDIGSLAVEATKVVHPGVRLNEAGLATVHFQRNSPDERPQECPPDAAGSSADGVPDPG
jgi:sugar lactone lactonase YvrE